MNRKIRLAVRKVLRILPDKLYLKIVYFLTFKRCLNLKNPKYWTEKMQYKKLYDRRSLVTMVADKVKVRKYAKDKLGVDIMPKILWIGDSPEDIPFAKLPNAFVIKTNHGSGTNIIVEDKSKIDKEIIISKLNYWLNMDYYYLEKEWAYKNIKRLVFVEELLYDEQGNIPSDIKLYMFNGKCKAVNIHIDRFGGNHQNILVDEHFKYFSDDGLHNIDATSITRPKTFDLMVQYAEKLSSDFDFIRVDFYDLGNQLALGELTNYPVGGFKRMPNELDEYLGSLWTLPESY